MSIEKKSLINTLKTTKKVNLTSPPVANQKDMKMKKMVNTLKAAAAHTTLKAAGQQNLRAAYLKSAKNVSKKSV